MSATVGFARHVSPALGAMLAQYPALRLRLLVDDAPIDLINARVDLAVRFGRLADSTWAARRLGALEWWLCASPEYLDRHGSPETPEALLAHGWVGFLLGPAEGAGLLLDLRGPQGAARSLRVEPRIVSNNQLSIQQMCDGGPGCGADG